MKGDLRLASSPPSLTESRAAYKMGWKARAIKAVAEAAETTAEQERRTKAQHAVEQIEPLLRELERLGIEPLPSPNHVDVTTGRAQITIDGITFGVVRHGRVGDKLVILFDCLACGASTQTDWISTLADLGRALTTPTPQEGHWPYCRVPEPAAAEPATCTDAEAELLRCLRALIHEESGR